MSNSDEQNLALRIKQLFLQPRCPFSPQIESLLALPASENSAGYPIISEVAFLTVLDEIPHLFQNGLDVLEICTSLEELLPNLIGFSDHEKTSMHNTLKVLKNIVFTAAITAPSDLWTLKLTLNSYAQLNLINLFQQTEWTRIESFQPTSHLNQQQFLADLSLFHSRGLIELDIEQNKFRGSLSPQAQDIFDNIVPLASDHLINWVPILTEYLSGLSTSHQNLIETHFQIPCSPIDKEDWVPDLFEIEVGYRLVPIVLSLRQLKLTKNLHQGTLIPSVAPLISPAMVDVMVASGICDREARVTKMGERVFSRGPGPFGIIHAYHSYLTQHQNLLLGKKENIWVARGENVAASQDANSKSFQKSLQSLEEFIEQHQYPLEVFIEHAVGQGEATRLHFSKNEGKNIQYVGADLEDAAIDKAVQAQSEGLLPPNMRFIRQADIGAPQTLLEPLSKLNIETERAVMIVGNGFHEVRDQTNEKMISVFKNYCAAKIIIIFTEESGLSNEDLLATGWNTYHAGFRYVHEISGQGLRPALSKDDDPNHPYSWHKCASLAGYKILAQYTTHSRTIYPHPKENGYNPSISVNYFCLPDHWAKKLNIK